MTADACNRRVVAGPVEATAIGNIMVQALAAGAVGSIAEAREAIRASFPVEEFLPQNPAPWDTAPPASNRSFPSNRLARNPRAGPTGSASGAAAVGATHFHSSPHLGIQWPPARTRLCQTPIT